MFFHRLLFLFGGFQKRAHESFLRISICVFNSVKQFCHTGIKVNLFYFNWSILSMNDRHLNISATLAQQVRKLCVRECS